MASSAVIGIEITDASGSAVAGLAAHLSPSTTCPQLAAERVSQHIIAMAAGIKPGAMRVRVDSGTDYTASDAWSVTGANWAAAEYVAFRSPSGQVWTITAVTSGAVSGDGTFDRSDTDNTAATNIRAAINSLNGLRQLVVASGATNEVIITAVRGGVLGNSIGQIDGTGNAITGLAALLTGGLDAGTRLTSAVAITHANLTADTDTLSIGSVTLTWVAASANENQITIGANATADGANLVTILHAHSKLAGLISAVNASGTVTITWLVDPRLAMLMLHATNDATAMALTQPSLGSRTYATSQSVRLYQLGAAT